MEIHLQTQSIVSLFLSTTSLGKVVVFHDRIPNGVIFILEKLEIPFKSLVWSSSYGGYRPTRIFEAFGGVCVGFLWQYE